MRVRRALLPFLLRSLYAPVVVVYLSVDVALHGAHGRFSSVSGLVRDSLVAVGWCSDYSLARAPRSLPPPSAVAARDAGWQSATLSHGFPLVFRETIQDDGEVKGTMFEGAPRGSRRVRPHGHCCACLHILACCRIFPIFCFLIALSVLRISISVALTLSRWGKLSDLSSNFLSWRLGVQTEFFASPLLPDRSIHWRLHQRRGFWNLIYWALQCPWRLDNRQCSLSRPQGLRGNSMDNYLLFNAVFYVAVQLTENWFDARL